jgi:hypothetical protein
MNENSQASGTQTWLGSAVIALLAAQLGLTWIQGSLLHRQHQDIQGLREDLQSLAESLDQGTSGPPEKEGVLVPARGRRLRRFPQTAARVTYLAHQEEPSDQPENAAKKDLEASKQSAQKAVKDAREVQQKLSFTENARLAEEKARKAEEKVRLEGAPFPWQKWFWTGLGAGLLALVLRNWLRRRG